MIVYTDPQGSDEWLAARRGVITASRFRDCRDKLKTTGAPSKACTAYALDAARERCGGRAPSKFQTGAMKQGTEQEPLARTAYELETGLVVTEAGFITTDDRRFGVSVDGLVGADGIVEIKTMVSSETLFRAVVVGDLSEYMDQCLGALWLLGRQWVDLVLWSPDLPRALTIRRIDRRSHEEDIERLERDLMAFARMVDDSEAALRAVLAEPELEAA